MPSTERLVAEIRRSPKGVRSSDLERVCRHYFGEPRQRRSSHQVLRTPWPGDPRVHIQDDHGSAKPYQVRQVLASIENMEQEER